MRHEDAHSVVVVNELSKTAEFNARTLGLEVLFESDFFLLLALPGDERDAIAFVLEEHPTAPPSGPAIAPGSSLFLTIQVADAAEAFEQLERSGVASGYQLS